MNEQKKLSRCKVANALLNAIWEQFETNAEDNDYKVDTNSIRYYLMPRWYKNAYAQGLMFICYDDVRILFKKCGYKCDNWSIEKLEKNYIYAINWATCLYVKELKKQFKTDSIVELAKQLGFFKELESYFLQFGQIY